jgi:probable H4MPT-linked C1 transfer pathway protein
MFHSVLGLDIGGANLKAADTGGRAWLQPFALWKDPARLPQALRQLLDRFPRSDALAVTMTGELCDCFQTKRHGVDVILSAVEAVADRAPILVWRTDGRLVDAATARQTPLLTAAANWLALASFVGRLASSGPALLLDIGSTTADIVPLHEGKPVPRGRTDAERLRSKELVYTGVRRTPVCALLGPAVAAELFATTRDVYLMLGMVPEDPTDHETADGGPATRPAAHGRLARMLGGDRETTTEEETRELARAVMARQVQMVREAVDAVSRRLPGPVGMVILAGTGEFLAREAITGEPLRPCHCLSLSERTGPALSHTACAYALAILTLEWSHVAI